MGSLLDKIIVALVILLIANFLMYPYFIIYPLSVELVELNEITYGQTRVALILSLLAILFVSGMRAMREKRSSIKTNLYLLIGFAGLVSGIAGFSWVFNFFNDEIRSTEHQYSQEHHKITEIMNSPHISNEKKSEASLLYAQIIYWNTGTTTVFRLPNGKQSIYQPTSKDIGQHQAFSAGINLYSEVRGIASYLQLLFGGVSILCLILIYAPFKRASSADERVT